LHTAPALEQRRQLGDLIIRKFTTDAVADAAIISKLAGQSPSCCIYSVAEVVWCAVNEVLRHIAYVMSALLEEHEASNSGRGPGNASRFGIVNARGLLIKRVALQMPCKAGCSGRVIMDLDELRGLPVGAAGCRISRLISIVPGGDVARCSLALQRMSHVSLVTKGAIMQTVCLRIKLHDKQTAQPGTELLS
jgi:hypothetical protein